ncbi:MAG: 4-hydroxy-tetrahydrodipicolinate reductase [Pseudomonadota bacterium]|jgi:dihydrodipicolinate reductase
MIRAAIIGATGRMGLAIARAASRSSDVRITAAVASPSSDKRGRDLGELAGCGTLGVPVDTQIDAVLERADVVIDFSQPAATSANVAACRAMRKPLLVGTTGFAAELERAFDAAAKEIPLLVAPNTSIGVTLLIELVRQAAAALPREFDIEIVEAHHRGKKDAPSGTALALGRAAAQGRGVSLDDVAVKNRADSGPRRDGDIGFAVVRGGDIVGEHSVLFAGDGEQLTLTHRATDRAIFAQGALRAAVWLAGQPPGRYSMRDFLIKKQ